MEHAVTGQGNDGGRRYRRFLSSWRWWRWRTAVGRRMRNSGQQWRMVVQELLIVILVLLLHTLAVVVVAAGGSAVLVVAGGAGGGGAGAWWRETAGQGSGIMELQILVAVAGQLVQEQSRQ